MTQSTKGAEYTEFPGLEEESKSETSTPAKPSFEEQVLAATSAMTQKEDGTWEVPDGLPEEVAYAAKLEKRRRDTQGAYTKVQQDAKRAQARAEALEEKVRKSVTLDLSVEQREELADLKATDPDAWRAKLDDYEQEAIAALDKDFSELDEVGERAVEEARRLELLQECLDNNPGLVLNDEVFENDLPPRITKALANGSISFEEFLKQSVEYLKPPVKVHNAGEGEEDEPNIGGAGGRSTASDTAVAEDIVASYTKEIY